MCHACDINRFRLILDLVNKSIIANPNTPLLVAGFELLAAWRSRNNGETLDAGPDASHDLCGQAP